MGSHRYDCIIVGSGPAGSSLAASLAKQGIDVLVLEKAALPRYKVCGGGVTKRALLKMPVDISSVLRDTIDTFELSLNGNNSKQFKYKNPIVYSVMRDELDYLLANHAVNNGTKLQTKTVVQRVEELADQVIVKTDNEEYFARYVIGADGVNSLVARQSGLVTKRRTAAAFECEIFADKEALEKYRHCIAIDYGIIPFGYGWIFPKGDHLSVGIGSYLYSHKQLTSHLERYIELNRLNSNSVKIKGSFLSAGGIQDHLQTSRIALIGDAAGLVEPFGGEGIYYALWSGELLAERIKETLRGEGESFSRYQADVDELILPEMQLIDRIANLFYQNTNHIHQLITLFPFLTKAGFEVLEGGSSYMSLYQKIKKLMGRTTALKIKTI
ncbi:NAD(P)/FAD-dependent oxidoreductase [Neobacillus sp. SM06]|uniref:NAD(P)/FAD-dependent oxidoreductase n=1 Tax=Neobacillus sp. SM06 TaxID=3422492 RepID=UPI003D271113